MFSFLGTACLYAALALSVHMVELPAPAAPALSPTLLAYAPTIEDSPLALRIVSGYTTVPHAGSEVLHLVHSTLTLSSSLHKDFAIDGFYRARALVGDPLPSMPERAGFQLRYVPHDLALNWLSWGMVAGGTFGAELKWDNPRQPVGNGFVGPMIGGTVWAMRWSLQTTIGYGVVRQEKKFAEEIPTNIAASTVWPLGREIELIVEGMGQGDMGKPNRPWEIFSTTGISLPLFALTRVHIAATGLRSHNHEFQWGGMAAISGQLGLGDLDQDGLDDEFDACPAAHGSTTYQGCSFEDKDGDDIWDRLDACPNEPGPASGAGCPLPEGDY